MNDLYKLNMLLKEMNWMAKEVDYLLHDLSRDEEVNENYRDIFDNWFGRFDTGFIEHMNEYTNAMIEEMEEE